MRRDQRDELLRGFLAINAMLREDVRKLRQRIAETKYNPNWAKQPRAPRGTPIGGQWVDGGGPKQTQRVQPANAAPRQPSPQRLPIPTNNNTPAAANDNAPLRIISRSALRVVPWTLAAGLSGDTPQPRIEARQITNDLFLIITERSGQRVASFQRVINPARRVPHLIFGAPTGLLSTEPALVENLPVGVRLEGDEFMFKGDALAAAYGRHITGITWDPSSASLPQIVPMTPEERRLEHNLQGMATEDQVAVAIQQLRNSEADGEPFMAALRKHGATPSQARRIRDRVRFQRSTRPYIPPTSGPLVDMFPGLSTAQGGQSLYAIDNVDLSISAREYSTEVRALAQEIRSIDPNYQSSALDASDLPAAQRQDHLDTLRLERAALLWRTRQEIQPLQIELIRLAQRRVDVAYADVSARYQAGELGDSPFALGDELDWIVRLELRDTLTQLGIPEDDVIGINRALRPRGRRELFPDAHIGDIFIEITVDEKDVRTDQIIDYFEDSYMVPTYVVVIHPRRIRRSLLITPPQRRYARGR